MITSNETLPNTSPRFIHLLTDKFIELHGDRIQWDDKSICGGLAWIEGKKLILISHQALTNHSSEDAGKQIGLRKITRLLSIAKQLKRPVLIMISETQSTTQSKERLTFNSIDAIIQNVRIMSHLPVPIIEVLAENSGIIDSIALAIADCIIAPHSLEVLVKEILNLGSKTVVDSDKINNKSESSQISELIHTVFIDNVEMIPTLRQVLPVKIDEFMSVPANDLISRRIAKIQQLSCLS